MPLTDTAVRNAKPGDKPAKMFDERGLFLIVTPGPKSAVGKAAVSRNAYRGGLRLLLRELARMLKDAKTTT